MYSVIKVLLCCCLLLPSLARADAAQRLSSFFQSTDSMRAQFHQTVLDAQNRKVQEVTGSMQLLRPGKFRWDYNKPYVQLVIGDGRKVWLYDPELDQVTVRSLDKMIGSSPAALLAGNKDIEKTFDIRADVRQGSMDWVEVTPKDKESGFERMYLGFNGENLQEMELHDSFGQTTVIEFSHLERNPKLNPQVFKFTPPKGADVVGD
ncbi:outer-membrane lipoprotein carrier protein precursor [mine drainage metagenome]|uniref:Outer-membrane lipoprotein carrier protein n=1 Tax=mine drainage metagenome TaxID=410659 RepID=A0A1J5QDP3_9ZZZZ